MENKRTLIAIALVLSLWSGFNYFFPPTKHELVNTPEKTVVEKQVNESTAPPNVSQLIDNTTLSPVVDERRITVKSDLFRFVFSTNGARLVDAQLLKFTQLNKPDSSLVKVIDEDLGLSSSFDVYGSDGLNLNKSLLYTFDNVSDEIILSSTESTSIVFKAFDKQGVLITKTFTFYPNKYFFDVDVNVLNNSPNAFSGVLNLSLFTHWDDSKKGDSYNFVGPVSYDGNDLFNDEPKKLSENVKVYDNKILWTSFTTKYFSNIVKPTGDSLNKVTVSIFNNIISNTVSSTPFTLNSGESKNFIYKSYLGPRDYDLLKETGLSFEYIIDLGFFGIIAKPLMTALKFFYGFLGNYGFAIVLLTACIKALFWPLTQKSYGSMKDMQKLQPEMQKLRSKHGKDKQKLNQEMMALYKENRVNPFGGCLPMLVQIPVFFALYRVLLESIELRHAPFMLWITDLSAADTLISDALGLGFALGPLPLIMGFTMFLQQKMSPTNMDPMQAKIMLFMPVFFTFIFLSFPSGLVIYWLVNNVLTIAQQYLINRKPA